MPTTTFTLRDAEGVEHQYEVVHHPATEGQAIMWELVALAAAPLGALIKGLLSGTEPINFRALLDDPEGMTRLGTMIDFGKVGGDVKTALASGSMPQLTAKILSRTRRSNEEGRMVELANRSNFDAAYTGNYAELLKAVWRVAQANRFLSLLGT